MLGNESGNESLLTEEESFDTGNESLLTEEDGIEDDSLDENMTTETEMPNPLDKSSELALEDDGDVLSQSQQGVTPDIDQKLETAAATILGVANATGGAVANATGGAENEQITNVQQVINNIAFAGSQGGSDINVIHKILTRK